MGWGGVAIIWVVFSLFFSLSLHNCIYIVVRAEDTVKLSYNKVGNGHAEVGRVDCDARRGLRSPSSEICCHSSHRYQ